MLAVASATPSISPTMATLTPSPVVRKSGSRPWMISEERSMNRLTRPSAQTVRGIAGRNGGGESLIARSLAAQQERGSRRLVDRSKGRLMDQKEREAPAKETEQPGAGPKAPPSQVGDLGKGSLEETPGGPSTPSPPGNGGQ